MHIVLVHPRGYFWTAVRQISAVACVMPPAGLASIAAMLRRKGHTVAMVDTALTPDVNNDDITGRILAMKPDMVGFTATTSGFPDAVDLCLRIKEEHSEVITVFGGVHASWGTTRLLEDFQAIDYIVSGEGERALCHLAEGDSDYERIYFRKGPGIVQGTKVLEPIALDELPFPAYDLLEGFPGRYLSPLFSYPKPPVATVISSRGCVYKCSYCDRSVFGESFRWNSPEYTFEQIRWLNRDFGVKHFNFYDDLFTFNRSRVAKLCEKLASSGMKVTFNCIVRIGHIDKELIKLLRIGGCWMVSVGIESGDQDILDTHKGRMDLEAVRKEVELMHRSGLWVKGLFMIGFPGETENSIRKTREFALSLPLKDANLTAFTPFPGAPITADIEEYGHFEDDWSKLDCVNFSFVPFGIRSKAYLEQQTALFYRQFYTRPFMRKHVYPKMIFTSPHSVWRCIKNAGTFISFRNRMNRLTKQ
jgi:radical SAM superfamily enzyme YgiQ (UPF0313 family)